MMVFPGIFQHQAHAADTYTAHETSMINTVNTIWTLVAAFLVFGMQAGFVMLEAGFARKKRNG
jgi:Amt family ammonium transporter